MRGTSGLRRSELSVRWDHDTSSWKTCQVSFLHLLTGEPQRMGEPWSESLPPSGSVSTGEHSELTMWAHPTDASVGGVSGWPTPNVRDYHAQGAGMNPASRSMGLSTQVQKQGWPTPTATERSGINPNTGQGAGLNLGAKNWPTPREEAGFKQPTHRYDKDGKLVLRSEYGKTGQGTFDTTLTTAVAAVTQNWPTPRKVDWKGSGPTVIRKDGKSRFDQLVYLAEQSQPGPQAQKTQTDGPLSSQSDQTSPQPSTKRLNPGFVEWIMGVPIGWTSLKPLAMESYQQWWLSFSGE